MRRVLLTVAYDGTDFHGFAYQEGVRTVEGVLQEAVEALTGARPELTGASRTDAGVHACGNLVSFDTESPVPAERFDLALNTKLPRDVRVVAAEEVPADFHPRATGWSKTYEYRILNTEKEDPVAMRYAYHYRGALDAGAMDRAAKALCGEHDFTSFCSVHSQSPTRIRTILECGVTAQDMSGTAGTHAVYGAYAPLTVRVTGTGFLYHMVRIIAGTLLEVGRGHFAETDLPLILQARDRSRAGRTLPPEGLFLLGYNRNTGNGERKGGDPCMTDT